MIYLEDEEYGVLYLVPITAGWYIELEEDYPSYFKLDKYKKKVEQSTREMPQAVWDKLHIEKNIM